MPPMLRKPLIAHGVGAEEGFHWRGGEIARFEGFSDAVFAFAVTLLVVSLEVPRTFNELLETMRGFGGFAICFAILVGVWYQQYIFFRRYNLQDGFTIFLNSVLIFVILFYVYPLKFLFSLVVDRFTGGDLYVHLANGHVEPRIMPQQSSLLLMIYSAGFVAIYVVFALLYRHAYSKRDALALSALERFDTKVSIEFALINMLIGSLSLLIAALSKPPLSGFAGWIYFLLGPALGLHGWYRGSRRRRMFEEEQ
jgi:hypothetical protein